MHNVHIYTFKVKHCFVEINLLIEENIKKKLYFYFFFSICIFLMKLLTFCFLYLDHFNAVGGYSSAEARYAAKYVSMSWLYFFCSQRYLHPLYYACEFRTFNLEREMLKMFNVCRILHKNSQIWNSYTQKRNVLYE